MKAETKEKLKQTARAGGNWVVRFLVDHPVLRGILIGLAVGFAIWGL